MLNYIFLIEQEVYILELNILIKSQQDGLI